MHNFVGVIDSGVGGLTILQKLVAVNNNQNFIYIADHAFCPYGTKTNDTILSRAEKLVGFLQEKGAYSVVIACNTASVFSDELRAKFAVPIYDVIEPTCKAVQKITKTKRVALLATNSTIANGAYQKTLLQSGIQTVDYACSKFVPFVENAATASISCLKTIEQTLKTLPQSNVDAVILGCTHFPLLKRQISYYCKNAELIECQCELPMLSVENGGMQGQITYYTTGNVDYANVAAKPFGSVHFKKLLL